MRPSATPSGQLNLLDWQPPEPVAKFDECRVRAASLPGRISHAISAALRDADAAGVDRDEIAQRMSRFLGTRISCTALNGYASEAREDRVISVPRFLALLHATRDRRLLELLAEPMGWSVVEHKHLLLIQLAAVQAKQQELKKQAEALMSAARAEGGL